jgi:uncharacterized protein (DUF2336 family)
MLEVDQGNLYRLARQRSERGRTELADAVSDIFREKGAKLSERERAHVFGILETVIGDVETRMRRRLSIQLASAPDVPHDLIVFLANDDIDIAFPILTRSPVLTDKDLMEVVWHRTLEHQLAVATRPGISEDVSQCLVETKDERVIRGLLENPDAHIAKATMAYLVEQSKRVDSFQEPLLRRRDLDVGLAKRMIGWVSAALRQHVIERFAIDPAELDALLEQAAVKEMGRAAAENRQPNRSAELAELLRAKGEATPELLYLALRDGEVALFVSLFARMTDLSETLIMRVVFDPAGDALAVACKAIGVGKGYFSSILALTRRARPSQVSAAAKTVRRVLTVYDGIAPSAARHMVDQWRFFGDYRAAIKTLQVGATQVGATGHG